MSELLEFADYLDRLGASEAQQQLAPEFNDVVRRTLRWVAREARARAALRKEVRDGDCG